MANGAHPKQPEYWDDVFLKETINDRVGLRANSVNEEVRDIIWVLIGTIGHDKTPRETGRIDRLEVSAEAWPLDLFSQFFDYYLKGNFL